VLESSLKPNRFYISSQNINQIKMYNSSVKDITGFIFSYLRREWKLFLMVFLGTTMQKGFSSITPLFYKQLVDALGKPSVGMQGLYAALFLIVASKLGAVVGARVYEFFLGALETNAMKKMGDDAFEYLQRHSYDFFINNFAGSLVKKLNRLPRAFETIIDQLMVGLYPTFLQIIIALIMVWNIGFVFPLVLLIWTIIFFVVNYYITLYRLKGDTEINEIDTRLSGNIADAISNNFNISLFAKYKEEQDRMEGVSEEWRRVYVKHWNSHNIIDGIQAFLMLVLEMALLFLAIKYWEKGLIGVGDFVLLQGILLQMFGNLWNFGRNLRHLGRGYSDAKEMIDIMKTPHEIFDLPGSKEIEISKGDIDIKDLDFSYNKSRKVFDKFNLKINAGRKIALVSKSGAGKSTLIKLLLRLYNVPENSIFIDGQDIMKVTQDSLRSQISLVPQDPILFHRTLADNIKYGKPDATMEEVVEAAKKAHCHEFISQLAEGYETFVGERGVKLSGGERQRVAIARAILENAPILVLDEATSSLDSESEHLIQEALKELMKNKTTIAVAHRLSTIIQMDEIIVIAKGKITERGTHGELLKNPESHYKKLWEIQAGGFTN
jgi:ATP-binding cassette subfamily B protein